MLTRKFFSASVVLVLVMSFVMACGGDDDDDDTTPAAGGSPTTALTPAGTGTSDSGASGTATTSGEATSASTMTDATPAGGTETTPADSAGTATESSTAAGTGTADEGSATSEATGEATGGTGSGTATAAGGSATTTGDDVTPDEQRLMDLLLSEDEALAILGDGWMETSRGPVSEDDGDSVGICGAEDFPGKDEKIAHVQADWATEDTNAIAFENIVEFPDEVVDEAMQYVHDSVNCTEWTDTDGSIATVATWDSPELADLGDDVVGIIVTTEVNGTPVDLYVAFVQTGNLITQVMHGDLSATDTATVEEVALDLVGSSIEKVEAGM